MNSSQAIQNLVTGFWRGWWWCGGAGRVVVEGVGDGGYEGTLIANSKKAIVG